MPQNTDNPTSRRTTGGSAKQPAADTRRTVTLGLVPSPEHCTKIATRISESLPGWLNRFIDPGVKWEIALTPDPLTGSDVAVSELLGEIDKRLHASKWDYAVCLTDLPIRRDQRIVVADADSARKIALISVPPLGIWRLPSRTRTMVLQVMQDIYGDTERSGTDVPDVPALSPFIVERITPIDAETGADVRYRAPEKLGYPRLLAGMVYANRPWSLFPSFKTTVAAAFATGGYGLIFSTLWQMGNTYGLARLAFLSVASVSLLVTWIIISHNLWETQEHTPSRYLATLYNSATIVTIATGAIFAYVIIFLLLLFAAAVFIPASMLEPEIGRPAVVLDYVNITWVTTSVATIGGAIGASMEDTRTVQNATFGWRQIHRFKEHEQDQDQDQEQDKESG